jgi:hypothetical protein
MGFGAVGVIMLVIVFVFYMKMVDSRAQSRKRKHQVASILEKADVFESVAKDQQALDVVQQGLKDYPDNAQLLFKAKQISERLKASDSQN